MKKITSVLLTLAVLLTVGIGLSRADVLVDLLKSGGSYGVATATASVDQTVKTTFTTDRPYHYRFIYRVWLKAGAANNAAIVSLNPVDHAAVKQFTLPSVTSTEEGLINLATGQVLANGAAAASVTNVFPVLLRTGDVLEFTDSLTNSATLYRIEYIDIPK